MIITLYILILLPGHISLVLSLLWLTGTDWLKMLLALLMLLWCCWAGHQSAVLGASSDSSRAVAWHSALCTPGPTLVTCLYTETPKPPILCMCHKNMRYKWLLYRILETAFRVQTPLSFCIFYFGAWTWDYWGLGLGLDNFKEIIGIGGGLPWNFELGLKLNWNKVLSISFFLVWRCLVSLSSAGQTRLTSELQTGSLGVTSVMTFEGNKEKDKCCDSISEGWDNQDKLNCLMSMVIYFYCLLR